MKVVLFGSIETAKECLKILANNFLKDEIIVVTDPNYGDRKTNTFSFAKKEKLRILTFDEINRSEEIFDYGFSIRFNKIFRKPLIEKFKYGLLNMHGGPLPKYKGSANHIFAILNEEKCFGTTLHFISEKIDEGDIIDKAEFPIEENDTGYDLLNKGKKVGILLFEKLIKKIVAGEEIKGIKQTMQTKIYKVSDLEQYKKVDLKSILDKELIKRCKAFYHPERNSIYTIIDGKKIELKYIPEES